MAAAVGCGSGYWVEVIGSRRNNNNNNYNKKKEKKGFRICCVSSAVSDPYKTLRIQPGATESEVRKAFRQLALQYHPDVCRGSNCGIQFHQINEAYDIVISRVREEASPESPDAGADEPMRGMFDQDWDMWEEWMGWEGAGIRDYTSHINPYI